MYFDCLCWFSDAAQLTVQLTAGQAGEDAALHARAMATNSEHGQWEHELLVVVPRVQPSEKPNLAADRVAERTAKWAIFINHAKENSYTTLLMPNTKGNMQSKA